MDNKIIELEIEDVVVTREYPNIFLENLPRLLLDRKLEFSIELLSRTAHISKASYRMALTEMKELKVRLQELLDLGFIRPSVSPWGASVLFVKKGWEYEVVY